MRIVGGTLKARQLSSPSSSQVRPTTDKLRSSIFSILDDAIVDAKVLDAFCGTGALGIEAYSRGAVSVDFLDISTKALKENLHLLPKNVYEVYTGDFLAKGVTISKQYDIIFFDPPYSKFNSSEVLSVVMDNYLLAERGLIVYEDFYKAEFTYPDSLQLLDERRYGDTIVRFLNKGA